MKRILDVVLTLAIAIVLAPLALAVAALVRTTMGRPVLFRQLRPGLEAKPFIFLKFRTMTEERDQDGVLLPDEARITRLGGFLRRVSLDELPQLWNVLRGDMSLVGPRPLLPEYLDRYSAHQARRHEVRPGITGLAQVQGRNDLSWEDKFELDVFYVDSHTMLMDMRILLRTLGSVLTRRGISADGHATMPEFRGEEPR